jgi:hypothetical protein
MLDYPSHVMASSRLLLGLALILLISGCLKSYQSSSTSDFQLQDQAPDISFYDVKSQTTNFIKFNSIELSQKEEKIMIDALTSIPAPCCSDYPALTCCCDCNLAKSIWGLSKFLITEYNYNSGQLREAVLAWIEFTNPQGYAGDACYTPGGCNRPFRYDGCGGMTEDIVIF